MRGGGRTIVPTVTQSGISIPLSGIIRHSGRTIVFWRHRISQQWRGLRSNLRPRKRYRSGTSALRSAVDGRARRARQHAVRNDLSHHHAAPSHQDQRAAKAGPRPFEPGRGRRCCPLAAWPARLPPRRRRPPATVPPGEASDDRHDRQAWRIVNIVLPAWSAIACPPDACPAVDGPAPRRISGRSETASRRCQTTRLLRSL